MEWQKMTHKQVRMEKKSNEGENVNHEEFDHKPRYIVYSLRSTHFHEYPRILPQPS